MKGELFMLLTHEPIARAILRAKGRNPKEFFGLSPESFKELSILANHCEDRLGLSVSGVQALGPNGRKGVRLSSAAKALTASSCPR